MQQTAELLGIDADALAHKCSQYSKVYVAEMISPGKDRAILTNYVTSHFSQEEMLYMSINWMNEKTREVIIKDLAARAREVHENATSGTNDSGV